MCGTQKMQDEMMDLVDYSSEIQETLGRSYNVPDDLDEEELMGGEILLQLPLSVF
jgi:hypothetical protein